jgi:hypothetical protein
VESLNEKHALAWWEKKRSQVEWWTSRLVHISTPLANKLTMHVKYSIIPQKFTPTKYQ